MDEMHKRNVQFAHVSFDFVIDRSGTDKVTAVWVQYFSDLGGTKEVSISDKELDWLLTATVHERLVHGFQSIMKRRRWSLASGRIVTSIYEDECILGDTHFPEGKFEPHDLM